jgi:hypothetical protein
MHALCFKHCFALPVCMAETSPPVCEAPFPDMELFLHARWCFETQARAGGAAPQQEAVPGKPLSRPVCTALTT